MSSSRLITLAVVYAVAAVANAQQALPAVGHNGGLDGCKVVLGSVPTGDGSFDQVSGFQSSLVTGVWSVPSTGLPDRPGDVFFVIPAVKGATYDSGVCRNTLTQLPQYNALAVPLPPNSTTSLNDVEVSQLSTVLVFGQAFGASEDAIKNAFGLDYSTDIVTENGGEGFVNDPSGPGGTFLREDTKIDVTTTMGATLLSNGSQAYASFSVLLSQAFGRAALSAANNRGYAVEQPPTAALDLNHPGTLAGIFLDAATHVDNTRDWTFPEHLNRASDSIIDLVANATANLADQIDGATSLSDLAQIENAAQGTIAPQIPGLIDGSITPETFLASTSPEAVANAPRGNTEGSTVLSDSQSTDETPSLPARGSPVIDRTASQASTAQKHHGLSGGAIAGIVIGCVVGLALIALAAAAVIRRTAGNRSGVSATPTSPHQGIGGIFGRLLGRHRQDHDSRYAIPNTAA